MVKHAIALFTYFVFLHGFMSCGDLYTEKEDKSNEYSQFATCEMDSEALTKILSKDVSSELVCLEHNLNLFINVVESDRPGYLQLDALKVYIANNMKDISDDTFQVISAVFEVNALVFGESSNFISRENLSKIVSAAKNLNEILVSNNVYEYFTSNEVMDFSEHNQRKSSIFSSFGKIGKIIQSLIVENSNQIIISEFLNKFSNIDNDNILDNVEDLLFIKKALLGGDQNTLTSAELKRLSTNANTIGKIIYDFINLPDTFPTSALEEYEIMQILNEDIQSTKDLFFYNKESSETIVTFDQLSRVVKTFFPEFVEYLVYKKSILRIKEIFIGNSNDAFSAKDVMTLLDDIILKNLNQGVFYFRSFIMNENILNDERKIRKKYFNFLTLNEDETLFKERFIDIVMDYRFLYGGEFTPIFESKYKRSGRGVFYVSVFENIVKRFMTFYGSEEQSVNNKPYISQKQLTNLMLDFSEIFVGEGYILPGRVANTAETITLMTSLFHNQSNGDNKIELPEFVEFINTIRASFALSDKMHSYFKDVCTVDEKGRIMPSCYRERFLDFMEQDAGTSQGLVKDYLPSLYQYLNDAKDRGELEQYLVSTSKFSRSCTVFTDGTEVPMKKGDFIVSWGGLLSIEQSIVKFDKNENEFLDPDEVDDAFNVYKAAVEGLLPAESLKKLSKDFFKYLVKYKKVPEIPEIDGFKSFWKALRETVHFGRFLLKSNSEQDASADRMTFAAVLKIIAENSPTNKENPYPCDTLK